MAVKRRNKIIAGVVFIFIVIILICAGGKDTEKKAEPVPMSAEDVKIKTVLEKFGSGKNLNLKYFYKGNFTNSGKIEFVAFYRDEINKDKYYDPYGYILILDSKNKIEKFYKFENLTFNPNKNFKEFEENKKKLGRQIEHGYIGDFNKNKREELYLFEVDHAETGWPMVFEFNDGKMKCILDGEKINFNFAKFIDIKDADKEKKEITFYDFFTEKDYTYVWSDKERRYIPNKVRSMTDAVVDNDTARIKELLNSGTDINKQYGDKGYTALHEAVYRGNEVMINFLLDNGADIESKDNNGRTPLMTAVSVYNGNRRVIVLLLSRGADINSKNNDGMSALEYLKKDKYLFEKLKEYIEKK